MKTGASEYRRGCEMARALWKADSGLLPGNRPLLLVQGKPTAVSILILHGYSASPFEVGDCARYFKALGYNVFAPRIAGHGGTRAAFDASTWREWRASALRGLEVARLLGRHVVVIGHSMGGLLATMLASEDPQGISALVLAAPAFHLADWKGYLAYLPPVRWVLPTLRFPVVHPEDKGHWQFEYGTSELVQLLDAARRAEPEVVRLELPVALTEASDDPVISREANQKIFARMRSRDKEMLVYPSDEHNVMMDYNPRQKEVFDWMAWFVKEYGQGGPAK